VRAGDRVPPEYDNLIAKVMVHAPDRAAAIDRLVAALDEVEVGGIQTTLPFHRFVARSSAFHAGDLSTEWVAGHWDGPARVAQAARLADVAAALAAAGPFAVAASRAPSADGHASDPETWVGAGLDAMVDRWPAS
jgi:acetyl/propionyl-CoA carboxylase alpha subunit